MDIKKQIGKKIQNIRKAKGFTQEKLAELIGIEPPSLSYIETGKFSPSMETVQKLSKVLNIDIWEFFYVENYSNEEMIVEINEAMKNNEKLVKIFFSLTKSLMYEK